MLSKMKSRLFLGKKLLLVLLSLLLATACSKKDVETPDQPIPEKPQESEKIAVVIEEEGEGVVEEATLVEAEGIEEIARTDDGTGSGSQIAIDPRYDGDGILGDSVWVDYMIKPGDYLSLIAHNEYGNANEWRRIYAWNREAIGDNPNLIFPYNELDLLKPKDNAIEWEYDHYIHTVVSGESLWTIAAKEYGDSYAWIVLFWDNHKLINDKDGNLYAGMQLKVRSELWPKF